MHSYVCKWQLASCRDALKRWGVGGGGGPALLCTMFHFL